MPNVPSALEQRRAHDFEIMTSAAAEVFSRPEIIQKLGVLGVDLATINENAFLPNIENGKIRIPKAYKNSLYPALIPAYWHKEDLFITPSVAHVRRVNRNLLNKELLAKRRPPAVPFVFWVSKYDNYLQFRNKAIPFDDKEGAYTTSMILSLFDTAIRNRALIIVDAHLIKKHPQALPGILAHEYIHAHDINTSTYSLSKAGHHTTWVEFRGHHGSKVIHGLDSVSEEVDMSRKVDRIRQDFGLEFPFDKDDIPLGAIAQMQDIGAI